MAFVFSRQERGTVCNEFCIATFLFLILFLSHPLNSWPVSSFLSALTAFFQRKSVQYQKNITGGILSRYLVHSSVPTMTSSAWQSFCLFCSVQPTGVKIPPLSRILDSLINLFHFTLAVFSCLKYSLCCYPREFPKMMFLSMCL